MSNYQRDMQRIVREFRVAGGSWPASAREMAEWAIRTGRWKMHPSGAIKVCAEELAQAMREEYMMDAKGRRVRVKHPATMKRPGQQTILTLWDDIRTASHPFMEIAFAQRRNQIVGDCRQLKLDVDSFNDREPTTAPIPLVLDFTKDVEELSRKGNQAA